LASANCEVDGSTESIVNLTPPLQSISISHHQTRGTFQTTLAATDLIFGLDTSQAFYYTFQNISIKSTNVTLKIHAQTFCTLFCCTVKFGTTLPCAYKLQNWTPYTCTFFPSRNLTVPSMTVLLSMLNI
jgi:hypothetical protein